MKIYKNAGPKSQGSSSEMKSSKGFEIVLFSRSYNYWVSIFVGQCKAQTLSFIIHIICKAGTKAYDSVKCPPKITFLQPFKSSNKYGLRRANL